MGINDNTIEYIARSVASNLSRVPATFWMILRRSSVLPFSFSIVVRNQEFQVELDAAPKKELGIDDPSTVNDFLILNVAVDNCREPAVTSPICATVELPMYRDEAYTTTSLLSGDSILGVLSSLPLLQIDDLKDI